MNLYTSRKYIVSLSDLVSNSLNTAWTLDFSSAVNLRRNAIREHWINQNRSRIGEHSKRNELHLSITYCIFFRSKMMIAQKNRLLDFISATRSFRAPITSSYSLAICSLFILKTSSKLELSKILNNIECHFWCRQWTHVSLDSPWILVFAPTRMRVSLDSNASFSGTVKPERNCLFCRSWPFVIAISIGASHQWALFQ